MTDLELVELAIRRTLSVLPGTDEAVPGADQAIYDALESVADNLAEIVAERREDYDKRNREENERQEAGRKAALERGRAEALAAIEKNTKP